MKKINKKIIALIGILIVVLIILALMVWRGKTMNESVSPEVASSRVIDFINETVPSVATINLIQTIKESGVYKITVEIDGQRYNVFTTLDGRFFFTEGIDLENRAVSEETEETIGGFVETNDEICLEDGKPIVYYFGRSECPFCIWQHPVIVEAMKPFEEYVSFKDNTDSENDRDIFFRYSDGGVPLIATGCRYFRLGAGGQEGDEDSDKDIISAITCKITDGQPAEVCNQLEEIINQI